MYVVNPVATPTPVLQLPLVVSASSPGAIVLALVSNPNTTLPFSTVVEVVIVPLDANVVEFASSYVIDPDPVTSYKKHPLDVVFELKFTVTVSVVASEDIESQVNNSNLYPPFVADVLDVHVLPIESVNEVIADPVVVLHPKRMTPKDPEEKSLVGLNAQELLLVEFDRVPLCVTVMAINPYTLPR